MARTDACEAAFIAGCDGAHSAVRQALAIGFPGGTYEHLFYVADVAARGTGDERRTPRRARHERFSCRLSVEGRRAGAPRSVRCAPTPNIHRENLSWDDVSCARHRVDAHRGRARALVLDLPACIIVSPIGSRKAARSCSETPLISTVPWVDRA